MRWVTFAGLSLLLAAGVSAKEPPSGEPKPVPYAIAHSLVKVRPDQPLPSGVGRGGTVSLVAARGECEAAHVVALAEDTALNALSMEAGALVLAGHKDARLSVRLYREAFIDVETPSNTEGTRGLWPDPLVPTVDAVAEEKRNAFPVDVPKGRSQPVFAEVCVPAKASPGVYEGTISVTARHLSTARVPVRVDVRPITIPATSSLPVTFGLSGRSLLFGHYGEKRDEHRMELVHRYARAALAHRISLHSMSLRPPPVQEKDGRVQVDWKEWDEEIGPYMTGLDELGGARFTAIDLRTPPELKGEALADYYRQVERHFRERGWLDRLFAYVMDEPPPEKHAELRSRLEAMKVAPGIRRLVTTPLEPSLEQLVDIWVPNINCLEIKERQGEFCAVHKPRRDYAKREKAGDAFWWYQSCSSHGCKRGPFGDAALDRYFSGWPSYMVDVDGAAARVMGWLAYTYDVGGELYFDMVYAYNGWDASRAERRDPWDSVWAFGGNGDGTLFYPGRPDRIGGRTHVPIESLRLKHIRDGLEDYELLRLLAARGPKERQQAETVARTLAPRLTRFDRRPESYDAARKRLFELLAPADSIARE